MATKIGHWPLQDFDSTSIIQAVTGANGTIIGGKTSALMSVAGPNAALPRAQKFGLGDYINIPPAGFARNNPQFTMMCWANIPPNTSVVQHPLISLQKETSVEWPRANIYVTRLANSVTGQFTTIMDNGPGDNIIQTFTPFTDVSGWRHYAIVIDYIGNSIKFYIDGVLRQSYPSLTGNPVSPDSDPSRFTLGFTNIYDSASPQYSSAAMADARFYNGLMTLGEINDAMNEAPETPPTLSPSPELEDETNLSPAPTQIWFTNWPNGQVERAEAGLTGLENREIISTGYIDLFQIEVDRENEQLYWTADKKIWKSNLDGTNLDWLIDNQENIVGLVLDPVNELIYYSTTNEIRVVNYDTTNDQLVIQATATSLALDIPGGQLCYINADSPVIKVLNLRNDTVRSLGISGAIGGLRVHMGRLWFTSGGPESAGVLSCDFLGADLRFEMLDTREFPKKPEQLEIDHTGIYLNTIDGPDEQWFTPPTIAGKFTGIAHGLIKSQIGEDIDWADYLSTQNSDDSEEPTNAVGDVTIMSTTESIPTPDATNKLITITSDKLALREIDISTIPIVANAPLNTSNELGFLSIFAFWMGNVGHENNIDSHSRLILVGDLTSNIGGVVIDPRPSRVVDLDTNHIYYCEGFDPVQPTANTIRKSHFGDIFSTEVVATRPNPVDLAVDISQNKLFTLTDSEIIRSNLDGTGGEILIDRNVGYSAQHSCVWDPINMLLIWTAERAEEYGVYRGRLTTAGRWVTIPSYVSSTVQPKGVLADPQLGHLYWCDGLTPTLFRMNYDGTGLTEISLGEHTPLYLKLGALSRLVYWSEPTGVYRAQLDGSDIELVVEADIHYRFDVLE